MSEMIERVAIAIRRNKFERNGRASVFDPSLITEEELGEARAAIEAMKEPSNNMIRAGDHAGGRAGKCESCPVTEGIWISMVYAALSEKP